MGLDNLILGEYMKIRLREGLFAETVDMPL